MVRKEKGFDPWRLPKNRNRISKRREKHLAISTHEMLTRSQSVVARVVAGETLIVPIRAKVGDLASIYSFNGTGTLIWRLLESPRTLAELISAVTREYEVESAQAEHDVTEFVSEMKAVGLVEVAATVTMAAEGPVGREGLAAAGA